MHNINRKLTVAFLLFSIITVGLLVGSRALATGDLQVAPDGPQTIPQLVAIMDKITNAIFAILMAVVTIFVLMAAYKFVSGSGNPEELSKAKQMLIYAVIGIAVALIAKGVPAITRNILGI